MLTYAQNFEDVMLARLFSKQSGGFYVDVGAWHPEIHSVTKYFYDLGWRGVNVEPIRRKWQGFAEARPRDVNLNVALSDRPGTARFYECVTDTALSTMDPRQAEELRRRSLPVDEYDVPVMTLNRIIEEHAPATVDFLKIDVEGAEAIVLAGIDLTKHRPRVLVIEATKPATAVEDWDRIDDIANWAAWESGVLDAGYEFAYYDGLSRFYVRAEEAALARRLRLPPGIYDRVEYPDTVRLREDHTARGQLIEQLSQTLQVCEADRAARLDVINRLDEMWKAANGGPSNDPAQR
jgi:FkbM family methyltransferase